MGRFINRKPIEIKLTDQIDRYVPIFDSGSNTWTTTDEVLSLEVFETFSSSFATGSFSGSFTGDGSGLENLDIFNVNESFLAPVAFTNQTIVNVSHNLDTEYPVVQIYDENRNQLIPDKIVSIDNNNIQVEFVTETTGFIVVMKGGHLLGSFGTVASNFTNETDITVNHNLNAPSPFVQVYNEVNEQIVPLKVKVLDKDNVQVTFSTPRSGQIIITRGGHIAIPSEFIESFSGSFTGSFLSQTDFLPSDTDVYDLGSPDKRWRDLYLSGSSIFLGDVVLTEEAGELTIKDSLGDSVPLQGTAASASYVEFSDIGNKPALVSGSSQITLSDTDGFTSYSGSVSSSLDEKVNITDIVNDLTTGGVEAPLSAEQGKVVQEGKVAKAGDTMSGLLQAKAGITTGDNAVLNHVDVFGSKGSVFLSQFGSLSDTNKWYGGVLAPNGKIYGIPYNSPTVLEIDPETQTTQTFGSLSGSAKWVGGVLAPNGKIYGIPFNSPTVLEIDPETQATQTFGSLLGTVKWFGGVLAPNGKIYGIPRNSTTVLEIDPETQATQTFGSLSGSAKWFGGVLAPNGKIYGIPSNSTTVLEISGAQFGSNWWALSPYTNKL